MTNSTADYTLCYWPVPFRGHFIRAILTYASANWEEGHDFVKWMGAAADKQPIPFMGPPVLIVNETGFALSQMPAIAFYLGERLGLLPGSLEGKALALKVVNDANDIIDELTLQGGMEMWTTESWQEYLPRLKRWMGFGEELLAQSSTAYLLGTSEPTVADIVTATLWMTVSERFPTIGELLNETAPQTAALAKRLWDGPLDDFAKQSWETYGASYCGGRIEASLKKVVNGAS